MVQGHDSSKKQPLVDRWLDITSKPTSK